MGEKYMELKKYSLVILSIILILLVFASSASAADANGTDTLSIDESTNIENDLSSIDNNVENNELDNNTLETSTDEVLTAENTCWYVNGSVEHSGNGKSPESAFKTLTDAISASSNNDIIMIASGEYKGLYNTDLSIDKNLNFIKYGEGEAIFDAEENHQIWEVWASSINITGLTFKNGRSSLGGAIHFTQSLSNSNINATFINNFAKDAGVFYFAGTVSNSTITGTYINNSATEWGGVSYFRDSVSGLTIDGTYINNTAIGADGGVNYFSESVSDLNIGGTYDNNTARQWGGVNYFHESVSGLTITGTYANNKATDFGVYGISSDGGVNYFKKEVSNSSITGTFSNNTATGYGGVSYFRNSVSGLNVTGTYSNNNALEGGANSLYSVSGSNIGGTYSNNNATLGGANRLLFVSGLNVTGTYTNNLAEYGGANYFIIVSDSTIDGTYDNNTAEAGGANLFRGSVSGLNVTGTYSNNNASLFGGANCFLDSVSGLNLDGKYTNNIADCGGANYFEGNVSDSTISGTYDSNIAYTEGGANNFNNVSDSNVTGTYSNNTAEAGGANLFRGSVSGSTINGTYFDNIGYYAGGANCINIVSDSTIDGTYDNNTAENGGANYFNGVSGSNITGTYTNNVAEYDGGANFFEGSVSDSTIDGTYINNTVILREEYNGGGANCFYDTVSDSTISGTYSNNSALEGGANFFFYDVSDSTIDGTYDNNIAEYGGGANYFCNSVSNSNVTGTYSNNNATGDGGANCFEGSVSDSTINGTYDNNTAEYGGANSFWGSVEGSNVTGSYSNNKAEFSGGANSFYDVSDSTIDGTYINNTVSGQDDYLGGGANCFEATVSDSTIGGTYINNTVSGQEDYGGGGAIYFIESVLDSTITGIFINNTSPNAIIQIGVDEEEGFSANITNSIFLNNKCGYEIYASSEGVVVKDSWFGNNASDYMNEPNNYNVQIDNWLFLNATADNSSLLVRDSSNVTFMLYSTNGTDVSDFDNSKLPVVNLILTATNGDVDNNTTLDNAVEYTATETGEGSVTAKIENASYTIYFDNYVDLVISAPDLVKYYHGPERFIVTVTDSKGRGLFNKSVKITINGITYSKITDENGNASLNIILNSGEYLVNVSVDDEKVNSTVTVKPTIDASDVVKMFRNDTQYSATFLDVDGTPLPNIPVFFNINGRLYSRVTDENGTAVLNINLDAGDYLITALNSVTGENRSNPIKVISLIESSDLTKYYKNDSQFTVRIHSDNGSYVGAGEEVKFNINGVFYTKKTNETGHATLNINLPQGNYTITTYYKDCSQGNNVEVLPILNASDLKMKYKDGSQFKAKLVDGQGNAYAGQIVQFNINGVLYNKETDSDGIAKLNINLMPGEYIITSSYNGSNIANKITISG